MFRASPLPFYDARVQDLTGPESAVIHTLAYFSLFQHPLREEELGRYLQFCPMEGTALTSTLDALSGAGLIECSEGLYYLAGQRSLTAVRNKRTRLAQPWLARIKTSVWVLRHIPFVEGLALSGSLSKGTQDPGGDLDFMLLCRPRKLWTTALFLSAFHKLLGPQRKKRFCTNFLLATDHLLIDQRNLFTATEIVFLAPLVNGPLWQAFFQENAWVREFYPNWTPPQGGGPSSFRLPLSGLLEWALSGSWGDRVVQASFGWRANRRRRKTRGVCEPPPERRTDASEIIFFRPARSGLLRDKWEHALEEFELQHRVKLARWSWEWDQPQIAPEPTPLIVALAPREPWCRPDASTQSAPA